MTRSAQCRHFVLGLCAMSLALAWAAPASAQVATNCRLSPVPVYFGFPASVSVPIGAPNGTVLAATTVSVSYTCPGMRSPAGWSFTYRALFKPSPDVQGDLYSSTGNNGLAIRVTNLNTGQQMKNDLSYGLAQWMPPITGSAPVSGTLDVKFELVKLNDLIYNQPSAGWQGSILFGDFRVINNGNPNYYTSSNIYWTSVGMSIRPVPRSCRVTSQTTNVPLKKIWTSELPAPNTTAGDTPFHVGLSCSAGTNVFVTLTDLTNPGNTTDQLSLATGSTASGVRLRLLRPNGVPVSFGQDSASAGNPNQWYVGPSSSTTGIPLTAQYISTGPVTGGVVKGLASFTLNYQ